MDGRGATRPRRVRRLLAELVIAAALVAIGMRIGRTPTSPSAPAPVAPSVGDRVGLASRVVDRDVPAGFAETSAGAAAAATAFAQILAGPKLADPAAYRVAVSDISAPDSRSRLVDSAISAMTTLERLYHLQANAARGVAVAIEVVPLRYRVVQADAEKAEVDIWLETIIAEDGLVAPLSVYATGSYSLTWADGDWKLADVATVDGPTPGEATGSASPPLPDALRSFRTYEVTPSG